jgi:nucleoid DNA-binding protein
MANIVTFRRDLANAVWKNHDVSQVEARAILETIHCAIVDALFDGEAVRIGEIGLLLPAIRKPRKRYNQVKGAVGTEPEHRVLRLRVASGFKERFSKGKNAPGKLRPAPKAPVRGVSKDSTAKSKGSKASGAK